VLPGLLLPPANTPTQQRTNAHGNPHATQVKANGLVVFVPRFGIEGPVLLTPKDDPLQGASAGAGTGADQQQPQFVLDEDRQSVVSGDGALRFSVFDKCAVRVSVVEGAARRRSIKLELVPRSELAPGDVVA
jgi:exosome complex exonuclease DIS3/RRP44